MPEWPILLNKRRYFLIGTDKAAPIAVALRVSNKDLKIFPVGGEAGKMRFYETLAILRSAGGLCYWLGVR